VVLLPRLKERDRIASALERAGARVLRAAVTRTVPGKAAALEASFADSGRFRERCTACTFSSSCALDRTISALRRPASGRSTASNSAGAVTGPTLPGSIR